MGPERHPIQLGAFDFDRAMGKAGKKKAEAKGGFFDAPWTAGVDIFGGCCGGFLDSFSGDGTAHGDGLPHHLGMSENGVYPQWNSHFS